MRENEERGVAPESAHYTNLSGANLYEQPALAPSHERAQRE
jgi:hypothetical protein